MADIILKFWLPIVTALIGAYITYYFTNRSKREESMVRFKEEKYAKLLIKLQGFLEGSNSSQVKKEFFEEQYQSWLYCSDEVVIAMNELIELMKINHGQAPAPQDGRKAIGNIVLAMRKDLLGKTKLDYLAFQYTQVIDRPRQKNH